VDLVVNSHLHYDHSGGNGQIPDAEVVVQGPRMGPHAQSRRDQDLGYLSQDFDTGQRVARSRASTTCSGDGSVVCLPTYGHTLANSRCGCAPSRAANSFSVATLVT